jgi:hypothetical protein
MLYVTIHAKLTDITEEVNSNPEVAEARMSPTLKPFELGHPN